MSAMGGPVQVDCVQSSESFLVAKQQKAEHWKFLIKLGETALTVTIKGNMGTVFLTFLIYLLKKRKY